MRDGAIEHAQFYWPQSAIKHPDRDDWQTLLAAASDMRADEPELRRLALAVSAAVPGFWSVDMLQDASGKWWVTDMAEGERSFKYGKNEDNYEPPWWTDDMAEGEMFF